MDRRIFFAFALSLLLLVAVTFLYGYNFSRVNAHIERVNRARRVMTALERLSNHLKSAQIYSPHYASTNDRRYYELYKQETDSIPSEISRLQLLVRGSAEQEKRVDSVEALIYKHLPALRQMNIVELINAGQSWRLAELFLTHEIINRAVQAERTQLRNSQAELDASTRLTSLLSLLFSVVAVGIIALAFVSNFMMARKGRRLESFLESILNSSQNGIVSYKAVRKNGDIVDFRVEYANASLEKLLGLKPANVVGKRLTDMNSHVVASNLIQKYKEVVETGRSLEFETLYKRDGFEKWMYASLSKRDDGLTASFSDIGEIKRYENELKTTIAQLETSNAELAQYAYVASHDLQEPLRKIQTFSTALRAKAHMLDEKSKSYLDRMTAASQRMSELIRDILNYSSLKKEDTFIDVDLNLVLEQVIEDLELLIVQKDADVKAEQLPIVQGIPLQLNQLFYNLLNNALKFTRPSTKALVRVTGRFLSPSEIKRWPKLNSEVPHCEIVFSDNGIGFDAKYAEQIFGLFKRLNNREQFQGSGIGLTLCRKVVENHGGIIYATGVENEGAAFHVLLPVRQPTQSA